MLHVICDMKSGRTVSVSVPLFSPCPYKCLICKCVLYIKSYCDLVVFENYMLLNRLCHYH